MRRENVAKSKAKIKELAAEHKKIKELKMKKGDVDEEMDQSVDGKDSDNDESKSNQVK